MAPINLSRQDRIYLERIVATEVDHRLAKSNPEEYQRQVAGVVDTVLNRIASPQFPDTVADVANQPSQFSAINGPTDRGYKVWGSVDNVPDSIVPEVARTAVNDWLNARIDGTPSSVGGNLHYANPNFSDAKNRVWIDALDGPKFGAGQSVHYHGTTEGFTPIEAQVTGDRYSANGDLLPPGEIPNVVASELDTAPAPRQAPVPRPAGERPVGTGQPLAPQVQYEYAPNGRPRDPDNMFLMAPDDPRYADAASRSPNPQVRAQALAAAPSAQTAQTARAGAPVPRPVSERPESPAQVRLPEIAPPAVAPQRQDLAGRMDAATGLGPRPQTYAGQEGRERTRQGVTVAPAANRAAEMAQPTPATPILAADGGGIYAYEDRSIQPAQVVGGVGSLTPDTRPAPTARPQVPPGPVRRVEPSIAGNVQMAPGARPAAADQLVRDAENANRRAQITRSQSFAAQDGAGQGFQAPRPVVRTTRPQSFAAQEGARPADARTEARPAGSAPAAPPAQPAGPNIGARPRVEPTGLAGAPPNIGARPRDVATPPASTVAAASPADIPKYVTRVEKIAIPQRFAGEDAAKPKLDGRAAIPKGEMIYSGSRDAKDQQPLSQEGAKDLVERYFTRTVTELNPAWIERQPAATPTQKPAAPNPVSATPQQGQTVVGGARRAIGLPAEGLGPGIRRQAQGALSSVGQAIGLGPILSGRPGSAQAGIPVGAVLGTAANGGQIIQGKNGVMNSKTQESDWWKQATGNT